MVFVGEMAPVKPCFLGLYADFIKPTSGVIKIDNKTLHKDMSFPESIGVIIEYPGFWDYYTGYENLKVLASIKNIVNDEDIKNSLKRVGLDPEDRRTYKKYSLGMKQRLGIAQAIMEKPDLIILDEPTNALDEEGIMMVRNLLLEEKTRGATILIASHNQQDIKILADDIYKMQDGKLITNNIK